MSDALCPCGSGSPLDACCGPYIRGEKLPPTAEALMRSRYTAYTINAIDYVVDTEEAKDTDRNATLEWNKGVEWQGLTVISTDKGGPEDEEGVVEFEARYKEFHEGHGHHHDEVHKERARFRKKQGRWLYRDRVPAEPLRAAPKVGRNDPCPCGSGKKFKKCHGT